MRAAACGVGACQGALGQRGVSLLGPLSDIAALALVLCRGGGGSVSCLCPAESEQLCAGG